MKDYKGFSSVLLLCLLTAVGIILGLYYYTNAKTRISIETPGIVVNDASIKNNPVDISGDYAEDTGVPNQKKYKSDALGVSFVYLEKQGNEKIKVEEQDNKIYLYSENYARDSGQYVEVFSKKPEDSLLIAIEKQFLNGYSKADCEAYISESKGKYPASYEKGNIRVTDWIDMDDLFARYDKCPYGYTESNGVSFFLADTKHPDKLLFFSIGQYAIRADNTQYDGKSWQDTVAFLD